MKGGLEEVCFTAREKEKAPGGRGERAAGVGAVRRKTETDRGR